MRTVCIAGASGFIGVNLAHRFRNEGFNVHLLSRKDFQEGNIGEKIKNCSIVVNLVGESIAGFWTKRKKGKIYNSRILTTRVLVDSINLAGDKVELLIQVSGVGIYDHHHIHTEESIQYDDGFLSRVIHDWEGELSNIRNGLIRVVVLRLGIVLDKHGGLLKQMMVPLQLRIGFGVNSQENFPFLQLDDLMRVFMFCVEKKEIKGVVNVTAPVLTTIKQFFREVFLARKGKIMIWMGKRLILLLMGESGSLLTNGQSVIPAKLTNEGFKFRYDNIKDALNRACN